MTLNDGFDRTVSDWLDDQAGHGMPGYLDEVLIRTTRTRQRPWWSSRERWLPMQTTLRLAPVPRIAWLALVVVLVAALGVAALAIGSRHRQPAPPFGLARNGAILYEGTDHHIYSMDPATNVSRPLTTGSVADHGPWLAPDGTRFLFARDSTVTDPVKGTLEPVFMVANADGSDVRPITGPMVNADFADWAPDGTRVYAVSDINSTPSIQVFTIDGSAKPVVIDTPGLAPNYVQFTPDGSRLIFRGSAGDVSGIYSVGADGQGLRTIRPPTGGMDAPILSPDGTKIAYQLWDSYGVVRLIATDSGVDSMPFLDPPATATVFDLNPQWSSDGSSLIFQRYSPDGYRVAIAPATGGKVLEMGPTMPTGTDGADLMVSPDGTKILAFYNADKSSWMLDVKTGTATKLTSITEPATWQRLAP